MNTTMNTTMNTPVRFGGPEMPIVWRLLPDWVQYLAINNNGEVLAMSSKPLWQRDYWDLPGHHHKLRILSFFVFDTEGINPPTSLLERPHVWTVPDENTPVDTPVWVRSDTNDVWRPRKHAAVICGRFFAWYGQGQSSVATCAIAWRHVVLADPKDQTRVPPMDK